MSLMEAHVREDPEAIAASVKERLETGTGRWDVDRLLSAAVEKGKRRSRSTEWGMWGFVLSLVLAAGAAIVAQEHRLTVLEVASEASREAATELKTAVKSLTDAVVELRLEMAKGAK